MHLIFALGQVSAFFSIVPILSHGYTDIPSTVEGYTWCKMSDVLEFWNDLSCHKDQFCKNDQAHCKTEELWQYNVAESYYERFEVMQCRSNYCEMIQDCSKPGYYCIAGPQSIKSNNTIGSDSVDNDHRAVLYHSNITAFMCDPGYFCPAGQRISYPCEAGYYCPSGSFEPQTCPEDHFCTEKSGFPTECMPDICGEHEIFIKCNGEEDSRCYKVEAITEGGKTFLAVFLLPLVALITVAFCYSAEHSSPKNPLDDPLSTMIWIGFVVLFAIPSWVFSTFVPFSGGKWVHKMEQKFPVIIICIVTICMALSMFACAWKAKTSMTVVNKKVLGLKWGCGGSAAAAVMCGFVIGWCMVMGILADSAYALYETENAHSSRGMLPVFNTVLVFSMVVMFSEVVIPFRDFSPYFLEDVLDSEFKSKYLLIFLGYADLSSDVAFMATINNNDEYNRFHVVLMVLVISVLSSISISFIFKEPLWLLIASAGETRKDFDPHAHSYNRTAILWLQVVPLFILQMWIMSDNTSASWHCILIGVSSVIITIVDSTNKHWRTVSDFVEHVRVNNGDIFKSVGSFAWQYNSNRVGVLPT